MSRRIRLDLQYLGTSYAGWQLQPDVPTIQGLLEEAASRIGLGSVRMHGSGRTDAGVHARGQVAHFDTDSTLPPDRMRSALNHFLPWDVRVLEAAEAAPDFHARESAVSKQYRYRIFRGEVMPPFLYLVAHHERQPLDVDAMRGAASVLIGTHDFGSLRSAGSSTETTVRTVVRSEVTEDGLELVYRIEADGFLYKMVRTIVGTLLEVGRGRRPEREMSALLERPDRALAGFVAPPCGLHLWCVHYDRAEHQDCNRQAWLGFHRERG